MPFAPSRPRRWIPFLEPADPARLAVTLNRLRTEKEAARHAEPSRRLHLRVDGRSQILLPVEIPMPHAEADFTGVISSGGGDHLVRHVHPMRRSRRAAEAEEAGDLHKRGGGRRRSARL